MIYGLPTKHGVGIRIYGDYYDLRSLHDTVHTLTDSYPLTNKFGEYVLHLAYEIRHAYQGEREIKKMGYEKEFIVADYEKVIYLGFPMLWTYFLVHVGLLRWAASFQSVSRDVQANLFTLEACAEQALTKYDPAVGPECFDIYKSFSGFPNDYLLQFIDQCSLEFINTPGSAKARFKSLPAILKMLHPMSNEYRKFRDHMKLEAQKYNCSPDNLESTVEWPDFKW